MAYGICLKINGKKPAYNEPTPSVDRIFAKPEARPVAYYTRREGDIVNV
jgi:hypothetical protein